MNRSLVSPKSLIEFKAGNQSDYDEIERNQDTLYFLSDSKRIYKGDQLMCSSDLEISESELGYDQMMNNKIYASIAHEGIRLYARQPITQAELDNAANSDDPLAVEMLKQTISIDEFSLFESGSIVSPLEYQPANVTKLYMDGTYRLIGGFCYLTASADLYPGWGVVYYKLPVAAIHPSCSIYYFHTKDRNVIPLKIKTASDSNKSVVAIEQLYYDKNSNTLPSYSPESQLGETKIQFTLCYKYR